MENKRTKCSKIGIRWISINRKNTLKYNSMLIVSFETAMRYNYINFYTYLFSHT